MIGDIVGKEKQLATDAFSPEFILTFNEIITRLLEMFETNAFRCLKKSQA